MPGFSMSTRRSFLQQAFVLSASGLALPASLVGCSSPPPAPARSTQPKARLPGKAPSTSALPSEKPGLTAPPDLFDAALLDIDFWVKPRTIDVYRPQTKERLTVQYWKDGEINQAAYERLCHMLRDVNGKASRDIDPRLLEVLWGTQGFVAKFGINSPIEILSGYRTPASNRRLQEQGVPAARKSLHMEGKAADIRIKGLDPAVLGNLVKSFRQGGVGFYYRPSSAGGWIHADTGLRRTWKG
jgi:uncharacterized protein YcbK (DUF882 family)